MGYRDILGLDPGTGNDSLGRLHPVIAGLVPATYRDASTNFAENEMKATPLILLCLSLIFHRLPGQAR